MILTEQDDEQLIARLATGDRDALEELLGRYERRIYGVAMAVLGDSTLAQDACQDALERICTRASNFDPARGRASHWIAAIARNAAIDLHRRLNRQGWIALEDAELSLQSGDPGPLESALSRDLCQRVRDALAALPVEQRRAIVMATYGGATAKEVAEREGIPLGTAKTRLRAAMLRLRDTLAEERRLPRVQFPLSAVGEPSPAGAHGEGDGLR